MSEVVNTCAVAIGGVKVAQDSPLQAAKCGSHIHEEQFAGQKSKESGKFSPAAFWRF